MSSRSESCVAEGGAAYSVSTLVRTARPLQPPSSSSEHARLNEAMPAARSRGTRSPLTNIVPSIVQARRRPLCTVPSKHRDRSPNKRAPRLVRFGFPAFLFKVLALNSKLTTRAFAHLGPARDLHPE